MLAVNSKKVPQPAAHAWILSLGPDDKHRNAGDVLRHARAVTSTS